MKKKIAAIVIFIFVLVFPMVSWPMLFPLDKTEINENRPPKKFPSFSNSFISEFDEFFTDHVPFRNNYIKAYSAFEVWLNGLYAKILDKLNVPYYVSKNNVLFGKEDWLFFLGDNSLSYYQGTNLPTEEELASFVEKAEKVNNYFVSQGKEFKIFIAPNKDQIYFEFLPNGISVKNSTKRIDMIVDYFQKHSNVEVIYPKQQLIASKENCQLYYKCDTHWNHAGGYYGTLPLLDALNIQRGEVIMEKIPYSSGDMLNMIAGNPVEDLDFNVNYRPEFSADIKFSNEQYYCTSTNPNGKNLFLLGDSFRHSMVPILSKEFTKSVFNTRNSFAAGALYETEFAQADTIIFECVERYEQYMFGANEVFDTFIKLYNL